MSSTDSLDSISTWKRSGKGVEKEWKRSGKGVEKEWKRS
jgi:hypothetical protein